MDDELRFHVDQYADDLVRTGVPITEARRRAGVEFGGIGARKEDIREALGLRLLDEVTGDLRYAIRQLRQSPAFTVVAVVSLALGIGANTAIFSLLDAVLFRTLPVKNPQELYYLAHGSGPQVQTSSNYPLFERYKELDIFSGVTASIGQSFKVATADGVELVTGQFVSGNYHAVLGVPIAIGRGFSSEPDRDLGRTPVAVISDSYWNRRFGRSPDVIGKALTVRGRPVTIVGVTAPGFHGLVAGSRAGIDITLPISVRALDDSRFLDDHGGWMPLVLVGRLKPGISESQALSATDAAFQRYMQEPEQQWIRASLATEFTDLFRSAALLPANRGSDGLRSQYTGRLGVLMAMVGIVLLIACANLANLMLARAAARARELAVRMSIGAGRLRLVRQLLTESLLVSLCGAGLGLLVANWSSDAILSLFSTGQNPIQLDVTLNSRVLLFTTIISLLTGIGSGLLPAIRATRVDVTSALKVSERLVDRGRRSATRNALVVAQVALCVMVIAAAGLLVRSLRNLQTLEAGFERENVVLFNLDARGPELSLIRRARFYSDLLDRLHELPGVQSAAYSTRSPVDFSSGTRRLFVPGVDAEGLHGVSTNVVTPEYFQVFGMGLIRGRAFTDQDRAGTAKVAIVSDSTARFYFGQSDPLGRTLRLGDEESITIVGVVRDVRHERLREEAPPKMLYLPLAQTAIVAAGLDSIVGMPERLTAEVRTSGDPGLLAASVRSEVRALSKDVVVDYVRTMEQQLDAALVSERVLGTLSTAFGLLALLLTSVGLYGVMSYGVARRTHEMGIRVALGARRDQSAWDDPPRGDVYGRCRHPDWRRYCHRSDSVHPGAAVSAFSRSIPRRFRAPCA